MKDIFVTIQDGKFNDIVFDTIPLVVDKKTYQHIYVKTIRTIENEPKLLQSLVKLFLTHEDNHLLNFGINQFNITIDEVLSALVFYNNITDTVTDSERIDEIVELTQDGTNFFIKLTTKKGTTTTLSLGV